MESEDIKHRNPCLLKIWLPATHVIGGHFGRVNLIELFTDYSDGFCSAYCH